MLCSMHYHRSFLKIKQCLLRVASIEVHNASEESVVFSTEDILFVVVSFFFTGIKSLHFEFFEVTVQVFVFELDILFCVQSLLSLFTLSPDRFYFIDLSLCSTRDYLRMFVSDAGLMSHHHKMFVRFIPNQFCED